MSFVSFHHEIAECQNSDGKIHLLNMLTTKNLTIFFFFNLFEQQERCPEDAQSVGALL